MFLTSEQWYWLGFKGCKNKRVDKFVHRNSLKRNAVNIIKPEEFDFGLFISFIFCICGNTSYSTDYYRKRKGFHMLEDFFLGNEAVWEIGKPDPGLVREISEGLKIPTLVAKVLVERGLTDREAIVNFLRPSVRNLYDPMMLPDMDKAVDRILSAMELKEKVVIYGDYDVDGITATSILYLFLKSQGLDVSYYIPDRLDEGYGISGAAVDYLCENNFDLMITVDCGITAKDRIDAIKEGLALKGRKMDIIITDHHQPDINNLPDAMALVNPHLPESTYPFDKLCGAGIAFKLVQELCNRLNLGNEYFNYIDLACLGTVADIVELTGENRIIVNTGIKKIKKCPNPGIQALLNAAEIKNESIDAYKLAFIIAPRINAAGRMGDATRAVKLLTSSDMSYNEEVARQLNDDNNLRQKIQNEIFQKASEIIENNPDYADEKVIVVTGDKWHKGVIGIVASMLVERYYKPTFVISVSEDEAVCSARGIDGFNIYDGMEYCRDLLVRYGGHEKAGGLTIRKSNIEKFRKKINEFADKVLDSADMRPKLRIDADVQLEEINYASADFLMKMAPFGEGNPCPLFRLKNVSILETMRIGADQSHLKLVLGTRENPVSAVAFKMGHMESLLHKNSKIDMVFQISINEYMGRKNTELFVKYIRMPENMIARNRILLEVSEKVEYLDNKSDWIYNRIYNQQVSCSDLVLTREELGLLYRYLQKAGSRIFTRSQLFEIAHILDDGTARMNYFKVLSGIQILNELDIIRYSCQKNGDYKIDIIGVKEKASLDSSKIYSFLRNLQESVKK